MDTSTIIFIISIIALAICLPICVCNAKENQKFKKEQNHILYDKRRQLDQEIQAFAQRISKDSSMTDIYESLKIIHNSSRQKYNRYWREHLSNKQIKTHQDSASSLGECGVSSVAFWYNLDKTNCKYFSPNTYFKRFDDDNIYKEMVNHLAKAKNNETTILQTDDDTIADGNLNMLKLRLDFYKQIYSNNIVFKWKSIPLEDIQCFRINGTVQYVSEVTGGGVNVGGAVAGAVLAGGAAAIIGSQLGTETKTNIIEKDNREISIIYSENGSFKTLNIKSKNNDATISTLRELMPQKEEAIVRLSSNKTEQLTAESKKSDISSADKIKKFKELLDMGAITQGEYDEKKRQLLGVDENLHYAKDNNSSNARKDFKIINPDGESINDDGDFLFVVEDVFSITGRGTVAFGNVEEGQISKYTDVIIHKPSGDVLSATVIGIEKFRSKGLDKASQGDGAVGLVLDGIDRSDICSGDTITKK